MTKYSRTLHQATIYKRAGASIQTILHAQLLCMGVSLSLLASHPTLGSWLLILVDECVCLFLQDSSPFCLFIQMEHCKILPCEYVRQCALANGRHIWSAATLIATRTLLSTSSRRLGACVGGQRPWIRWEATHSPSSPHRKRRENHEHPTRRTSHPRALPSLCCLQRTPAPNSTLHLRYIVRRPMDISYALG